MSSKLCVLCVHQFLQLILQLKTAYIRCHSIAADILVKTCPVQQVTHLHLLFPQKMWLIDCACIQL